MFQAILDENSQLETIMMLYIKANKLLLLIVTILVLSFLGIGVNIGSLLENLKNIANGGVADLISDAAINCGSVGSATSADGREWIGESGLKFKLSGESRSSSFRVGGGNHIPYRTSRISATEFRYTFAVIPGQKIVRLHFYPASYSGFEKWIDCFSVEAGPFTLLKDYSPSLAAKTLAKKYIIKEFCLNIEEYHRHLTITFYASLIGKSYAFVNGIEIISHPTGLYYTPENECGARIVGLSSNRLYIIDNSTALEVMHRFNIGGESINSMEDFRLFCHWDEDTDYLIDSHRARRVSHLALKFRHQNLQSFIVPAKIYQTSWKLEGASQAVYNFTWKVPVDLGFGYLVRLHFCELDCRMAERETRLFSVLINNQTVETKASVIGWGGDVGIPIYKDYLVLMERDDREGSSKSDHLLICLQSVDELVFGLLKGLEILKLSNLENNLAAHTNPVFPKGLSTCRTLENRHFSSLLDQNVIGSAMAILIVLLSILTYNLRKLWEENIHGGKSSKSSSVELSCRWFSLAEIKLATENFSEGCVIGKGGFGKVYKGVIPGVSQAVAIKRLNFYSRQGAREFWAEIKTLSKLRHIQLVSL
ncbi:OLC1v1030291C1 [Oldenlandia corymbosa var. corymbosa]|uniref:OLC1v1030291C1 n=1 Tax=Oldenlandia corymbosa var. corymbosa TaxID=529605 RepID=A0AAV1CHA7_OLDCO|nr:OLC1v1030291C1 [Oldenlandia corymbosa var. corymbosa]